MVVLDASAIAFLASSTAISASTGATPWLARGKAVSEAHRRHDARTGWSARLLRSSR